MNTLASVRETREEWESIARRPRRWIGTVVASIAGKGDRYIARWFTLSSITLEGARLVKKFWFNRPKVDRTPAKSREVPQ
jgi:hypothetical protein